MHDVVASANCLNVFDSMNRKCMLMVDERQLLQDSLEANQPNNVKISEGQNFNADYQGEPSDEMLHHCSSISLPLQEIGTSHFEKELHNSSSFLSTVNMQTDDCTDFNADYKFCKHVQQTTIKRTDAKSESFKKRTQSDSYLNNCDSRSSTRSQSKACRVSSIPALVLSDSSGRNSCLLESTELPEFLVRPDTESHRTNNGNDGNIFPVVSTSSTRVRNSDDLSVAREHPLLSPRRSCDSAYGSCLESANSIPLDETSTACLFGDHHENVVMDNDGNSGGMFTLCTEEMNNYPSTSLSLCLPFKNVSPFSSSSSVVSDVGTDTQLSTDDSTGSLQVDSERSMRKHSFSTNFSLRSSLSFEESEEDFASSDDSALHGMNARRNSKAKAQSSWTKIRRMVIWSPFTQSFKKKYPWVQLAGHAGNFQPGEEGRILKKFCEREAECLKGFTEDPMLFDFAPTFHGVVELSKEKYIQMQDLLLTFDCPSLMDCKMGVRTYLEDELAKAKVNPSLRKDMYQKMVEISPDEPTDEEREARAVTKPRYMQWREQVSSTSNLGFRIEGIKKSGKDPSKDYQLTKSIEQVTDAFKYFIDNNVTVLKKYIERLKNLRETLENCDFFHSREVIGSSLLFVHDSTGLANIWMIDFGKTSPLPNNQKLNHRAPWIEGNREDGYLFGVDNLLLVYENILRDMTSQKENVDHVVNSHSRCNDVEVGDVTNHVDRTARHSSPLMKWELRQQLGRVKSNDDVIVNDVNNLKLTERTSK